MISYSYDETALTHWILDIFSAAVSHGLSILGTKRKFGGHILKIAFSNLNNYLKSSLNK